MLVAIFCGRSSVLAIGAGLRTGTSLDVPCVRIGTSVDVLYMNTGTLVTLLHLKTGTQVRWTAALGWCSGN